ncbi:MAG: hypothetical protein ABIP35_10050 [Ginsengibacter sp.]
MLKSIKHISSLPQYIYQVSARLYETGLMNVSVCREARPGAFYLVKFTNSEFANFGKHSILIFSLLRSAGCINSGGYES